jgi:pimeloyl-ACP methyl ester carboxylesterase
MPPYSEVWFDAADGLRLFARDYNQAAVGKTPVLCLAGLTRNSKDFEAAMPLLARQRRVVALDNRGRGRSSYAEDWSTYRPEIEAEDAARLLQHLNIARAGILGTSRGGINAMLLAAKSKERIAGVLFNDIGPEIETAGLLRIRQLIDRRVPVSTWADAIEAIKANSPGYVNLSESQWETMARAIFRDDNGRPAYDFDARLGLIFPSLEDIVGGKVPALWGLFDLLKDVPVTVLRGEHSDLLSERIVAEMAKHHPTLDTVTVRDRGHIPLLDEPESVAAVIRWLERIDQAG